MATLVQTKLKTRKNNNLRYSEYYDQQNVRDELYVESVNGKIFDNLMPLITSQRKTKQSSHYGRLRACMM